MATKYDIWEQATATLSDIGDLKEELRKLAKSARDKNQKFNIENAAVCLEKCENYINAVDG